MSKKNLTENNASDEIESLNVDDLDIEELERRIELASAIPSIPDSWLCGADCGTNCTADCGNNCVGYCGGLCAANVCGSNTGCSSNGGCLSPDGSFVEECQ